MARAKFVPRPNALYEVRSSGPVKAAVNGLAARLAAQAGEGFTWSSQQGQRSPQGRWRAIVYPDTHSAFRRNARENTLARLLGGGSAPPSDGRVEYTNARGVTRRITAEQAAYYGRGRS